MAEQPRTARQTKEKEKKNALKHGVYSREPMLPGEKIRDYEALAAELNEEWVPDGPTEHGLVDRLTALKWRKQRLDRYEHLSLQQQVDQIDLKNEVNRHRTNLKNLGPEFAAAASVEMVEEILSMLSPFYRDTITGWVPREKCQDQSQRGQAISAYLSRLTPEDQVEGLAKFVAIVNPDSLEKELARADRIDEAIDRTIKRLMQVKTAKHVFPNMRKNAKADPTQINLPVPTNSNLQGSKSEQNVRLLDKVEISAKRDLKGAVEPAGYNQAVLEIT